VCKETVALLLTFGRLESGRQKFENGTKMIRFDKKLEKKIEKRT